MLTGGGSARLRVRSFGDCTLTAYVPSRPDGAEYTISADKGRTKKHWSLIRYLIFCGKSSVTVDELIEFLWPEDEASNMDDPGTALRVLVHRARAELNRLVLFRGADLIKYSNKSYRWNRAIDGDIDTCTLMAYGFNPELSAQSPFHGAASPLVDSSSRYRYF